MAMDDAGPRPLVVGVAPSLPVCDEEIALPIRASALRKSDFGGAERCPKHLVYSYRRGGFGLVRDAGPPNFAAIYYTFVHLPFAAAQIHAPCR